MSQSSDLIQSAQRTIRLELEAVEGLLAHIDADFVRACEMILASKGRVVVVGMGKSGHIGNKIAATLASTGTTAFFVHPAEARPWRHGHDYPRRHHPRAVQLGIDG